MLKLALLLAGRVLGLSTATVTGSLKAGVPGVRRQSGSCVIHQEGSGSFYLSYLYYVKTHSLVLN